MTDRILVLGGARSGKSSFAEASLACHTDVDYLATSERIPDDAEWEERVAKHRARRPSSWRTIEALDVATELGRSSERPLMIDCLTVWLTRQMDLAGIWDAQPGCGQKLRQAVDELVDAFATSTRHVVAVSNEVGQGIVPADPGSRRFRDEMGILNARVAGVVDRVYYCIAGLPQRIK